MLNSGGESTGHELPDLLEDRDYVDARLNPRADQPLYLHLIDLRRSLNEYATDEAIKILDYGCGGSPYQTLFPNAIYHRADYVPVPGIEFKVDTSGTLPEVANDSYDLVLSTQVLEHVASPQVYLTEAHRVLKKGGALVLTTHGAFPDHGCPYDFWRWTADGLSNELKKANFEVRKVYRLTCGLRAVLFWLGESLYHVIPRTGSIGNILLRLGRKIYNSKRAYFNQLLDRRLQHLAQVSGQTQPAEMDHCVALLAHARKLI